MDEERKIKLNQSETLDWMNILDKDDLLKWAETLHEITVLGRDENEGEGEDEDEILDNDVLDEKRPLKSEKSEYNEGINQ